MNLFDYCNELSIILKKKYHSQVYFLGGVLLRKQITDVDVYVYGENAANIQAGLDGCVFKDNKELEVLDSLSTDDFFDSNNLSLTEYILNNGLTRKISGFDFNKLTIKGLFLSKLAAYDQRNDETLKDLHDLKIILNKFEGKLPAELKKIAKRFELADTYKIIEEYLSRYAYY